MRREQMKNYKSITFMLAFVLLFIVAVATAADAPKLKFKFTKNNVPGAKQTEPLGINNAGVTVGTYQDTSGVWHGYILKGKKVTTLDDPNGSNAIATNLPYNGMTPVIGVYTNNSTHMSMAFRYQNGKFTDIPGPKGAIASEAVGINDKEDIVGYYEDSSHVWHGFLLKGKKYTTLDVPGAATSYADGVNNQGHIVLFWFDSSGCHSSLYKDKKYISIDVPGTKNPHANGINNEDDVAFWYGSNFACGYSALCTKCDSAGRMYYKFNYPKARTSYAEGINDKHTISGSYAAENCAGPYWGYKATY
jgi:uncharacterized membrane protein